MCIGRNGPRCTRRGDTGKASGRGVPGCAIADWRVGGLCFGRPDARDGPDGMERVAGVPSAARLSLPSKIVCSDLFWPSSAAVAPRASRTAMPSFVFTPALVPTAISAKVQSPPAVGAEPEGHHPDLCIAQWTRSDSRTSSTVISRKFRLSGTATRTCWPSCKPNSAIPAGDRIDSLPWR
ncbi:hypothetical protein FQZ97_427250 [compost metagenome]